MSRSFLSHHWLLLILVVVLIAFTGCEADDSDSLDGTNTATNTSTNTSTSATSATVTITATALSPSTVTIRVGGTVTWQNNDAQDHTLVSDDFTGGDLIVPQGGSVSHVYTTAGSHSYGRRSGSVDLNGIVIVQ